MKIKCLILALGIITMNESGAEERGPEGDPPVMMRLYRFTEMYREAFTEDPSKVIQTRLSSKTNEYIVSWDLRILKKRKVRITRELKIERLLEVALEFLHENLDNDLFKKNVNPFKKNVNPLSIMQFFVSPEIGKVTFFEFSVSETSTLAGLGWDKTIIVPISEGGVVLCVIDKE